VDVDTLSDLRLVESILARDLEHKSHR
jgi:hypothetical protein